MRSLYCFAVPLFVLVRLLSLTVRHAAFRVASGTAMEEHHIFDAKEEYVLMKCIEMFAESIPGCVLRKCASEGSVRAVREH